MSLKYGLNIKKRDNKAPVRPTLLDDDDGDEDETPQNNRDEQAITSFQATSSTRLKPNPPPKKSTRPSPNKPLQPPSLKQAPNRDEPHQDLSSLHAAQSRLAEAERLDSSIFDYDSFHDAKASVREAKKEAARQDAIERKPKYINNLLDAASRRKQDQLIAKEKLLQKEREAEGDEFADKEKFVTGAYKAQQEEARRLEEEEKRKAEEEEERKRKGGGGMQTFYKNMMEEGDRVHKEAIEAAAKMEKAGEKKGVVNGEEKKGKSDEELAAEMRAQGVKVHLNEEGQITDKRQLLSAGLNVTPSGRSDGSGGKGGADHLKTSNRPAQSAFPLKKFDQQQASRERQTRMMEEQLAAQQKRAREEEEEERAKIEKAAKSTKTDKDVNDAKARYLARKAAKERGEG